MKRLQLSRWVSDSTEVGCGLVQREVTAAVFFCRDSFSRAELFRPGQLGGNFDARDLSLHQNGDFSGSWGFKVSGLLLFRIVYNIVPVKQYLDVACLDHSMQLG